jgi:hypothetical protein
MSERTEQPNRDRSQGAEYDLGNLCQMFQTDVAAIRDAIKNGRTREAVNKCEAALKSLSTIRKGLDG